MINLFKLVAYRIVSFIDFNFYFGSKIHRVDLYSFQSPRLMFYHLTLLTDSFTKKNPGFLTWFFFIHLVTFLCVQFLDISIVYF